MIFLAKAALVAAAAWVAWFTYHVVQENERLYVENLIIRARYCELSESVRRPLIP